MPRTIVGAVRSTYTAGDSDHDNDKADEADDDYGYDSDDGRFEEDDDHIGESDVGSTSDARDEDLDCPAEDTSDRSDDSDYGSDLSKEDPAPPAPKRRDTPTSSSGPQIALYSADTVKKIKNRNPQRKPASLLATPSNSTTADTQAARRRRQRSAPQRKTVEYKRSAGAAESEPTDPNLSSI